MNKRTNCLQFIVLISFGRRGLEIGRLAAKSCGEDLKS